MAKETVEILIDGGKATPGPPLGPAIGPLGINMTCFTMGAHHAFNRPEKQIYWQDETVKYCHDFIKHIGIDPREISYIESCRRRVPSEHR